MADKELTANDIRKSLAETLKKVLVKHEDGLIALRARELKKNGVGAEEMMGGMTSLTQSEKMKKGGMCMVHGKSLEKCGPSCGVPKGPGKKMESEGSGGEIKAGKLRKDGMPSSERQMNISTKKPMPGMTPPVGVGGKQPVGQGGGDKHVVAPGMHPETAASLADVRGLAPTAKPMQSDLASKLQANPIKAGSQPKLPISPGRPSAPTSPFQPAAGGDWKSKGLPDLKSKLAAVAQSNVDLAADKKAGGVGFLNNIRSRMPSSQKPVDELAADKKAAGVGFLNNIMSRFRKAAPPAAVGEGPVRSSASPFAGVRGMAALHRSEAQTIGKVLLKSTGGCLLCGKAEHFSACR